MHCYDCLKYLSVCSLETEMEAACCCLCFWSFVWNAGLEPNPTIQKGGYDSKPVAGISLDGCICLPQGEGIHQIREALKILAERVLILETMIGIHGE